MFTRGGNRAETFENTGERKIGGRSEIVEVISEGPLGVQREELTLDEVGSCSTQGWYQIRW